MHNLKAVDLQKKFLNGELSAVSIVKYFLQRIEKYDKKIGAFLDVYAKEAIFLAKGLDEKRKKGLPLGKLAGIPIALKDNIHFQGKPLTCASKFLENYVSAFDATVTKLIIQADGIIIGKTNMDEFAMGASTNTSAFKKTYNPWNFQCSPGGSSGGSSAAVAAGLVPIALGSDTGGSIRQPAAFCGIVGFKPSYGRVSRYGLVPFASSFDQIGPMAKNCEDISLIMEVIGQYCDKDSTSLKVPRYSLPAKEIDSLKGMKIGVPWQFLEHLSADGKVVFKKHVHSLRKLGATIVDIDLDILKHSMALYYILASAEASTSLARFDGVCYGKRKEDVDSIEDLYLLCRKEGFGYEVKRRILLGTFILYSKKQNHYYEKALKVRSLIIEQFHRIFSQCCLVVMPTTPSEAFDAERVTDPTLMSLADMYTMCANIAGLCAISVPCGLAENNNPLGFQILGPIKEDEKVISAALTFEKNTNFSSLFHKKAPLYMR